MFESEKKSPLDRLKKGLYSRNTPDIEPSRHSIHGQELNVRESWDTPAADESGAPVEPAPVLPPKHRKIYKAIFWFSLGLLVIASAVASYTLFVGGNFVSVDNVQILIEGPAQTAGGAPLTLNVSVTNKNATDLQLVDLIAEYPSGTKDPSDPTKDLTLTRVSLGNIASQAIAQQTLTSLMYGQQGQVETIKFTAEYRTADSNAIFDKEKDYNVTISSSPVTVTMNTLDKVESGQPFDATITVASNTTTPVNGLLMSLDYPSGFTILSATPSASYGNNTWLIGTLAPGSSRTIDIKAEADGQDGEDKTIHASVGIQSATSEQEIATNIMTQDHDFTIEKPFLGVDLALDGNHSDEAVSPGSSVHADILWSNNSPSQITNATIVATLSGAYDKSSISPDSNGFYDSQANTITWQGGRTDGLDSIAPAANGRVGFQLTTDAQSVGQSTPNQQVTISVTASGSRTDETGAPAAVTTGVSHSVKLASDLELSARALYSQGPIANHGPMPPQADQGTTYTVVWTVTNTSNNITGAKVTASLPPYMTWTGLINPSDANISYDSQSGQITWDVGDVPENADIGSGAAQVAFQVSLKPSANQVGTSPDLVDTESISGTDVFTGSALNNTAPNLTTRITTDLLYKAGDETVVK